MGHWSMKHWSKDELNRTMDEVKRRSLVDAGFRSLAISHPDTAIARINPKPLPSGISIRFIVDTHDAHALPGPNSHVIIVLPPLIDKADELSDAELEQAAGGMTDISFELE